MSRHCLTLALLSILTMPGLSGCSVIGVIVGAHYDSERAVTRVDTVLQEGIGPYENSIRFMTSSGDIRRGELVEVSRAATGEYRDWYAQWQTSQQGGRFAPSLGDTISLILKADARAAAKGILIGLTEEAVVIHTTSLYSARDVEIPLAEIDTVIDGNGNRTAGADLRRDVSRRTIPIMTALVVALNGRDSSLAMQDVRWVELTYTERTAIGKLTGLFVGLLADAIIVTTVVFINSGGIDLGSGRN